MLGVSRPSAPSARPLQSISPLRTNGLKHGCYASEASIGPLGLLFGDCKISGGELEAEEFRRLLASIGEALLLCCTGVETATFRVERQVHSSR